MSSAWDADNFVPPPVRSNLFGEEDDVPVPDSWDQEPPEPQKHPTTTEKGKEKSKGKAVAAFLPNAPDRILTAEELAAERERIQQMQINSDLGMAAETFGINGVFALDRAHPVTKSEFDEFKKALMDKFDSIKKSPNYAPFFHELVKEVCLQMKAKDVLYLSKDLEKLSAEMFKMEKEKDKPKQPAANKKKVDVKLPKVKGELDDIISAGVDGGAGAEAAEDYDDEDFM